MTFINAVAVCGLVGSILYVLLILWQFGRMTLNQQIACEGKLGTLIMRSVVVAFFAILWLLFG